MWDLLFIYVAMQYMAQAWTHQLEQEKLEEV